MVKKYDTETRLEYSFEHGIDLKRRIILLDEKLEEKHFRRVDMALNLFESEPSVPVTIRIMSEGGDAYTAMAIVGRIERAQQYHKMKIITEGYGSVFSAAAPILVAGDVRRMSKRAHFMYHEASFKESGKQTHMYDTAKQGDREDATWAKFMASKTKLSTHNWRNVTRDFYMSADEALMNGIVDELF